MTEAAALAETAPAKVNLDLLVTARRLDGYHELDSIVVFARDQADGLIVVGSVSGPRGELAARMSLVVSTDRWSSAAALRASCGPASPSPVISA